jgi:trehalose-6-phosphate hydrolase
VRRLEEHSLLVLNNFFPTETTINIPEEFLTGNILIDNYETQAVDEVITLKPYQTIAIYH